MAAAAASEAILDTLVPPLSKECLAMLHFLHNKNLERALSILEHEGVKRVVAERSRRTIYLVHGETRTSDEHLCFPRNFCSCYSFFHDVVMRKQHLCCKHQLAARLAGSLGVCKEEVVSDEELAILLMEKRSKQQPKGKVQVHYFLQEHETPGA